MTLPTAFAAGAKQAGVSHAALLSGAGADATTNYDTLWGRVMGTAAGGPYGAWIKGTVEVCFC